MNGTERAKKIKAFLDKEERPMEWLSRKTGLSISTIYKLMSGEGGHNIQTIRKVAGVIGVKPGELM